jgi:hypothetical protein
LPAIEPLTLAVDMDVRYVSIYRVVGLIGLPNDADVELFPACALGGRALLTVNREPYYLHLRRRKSFGIMIAQTLAGGGSQVDASARARFDAIFARTVIRQSVGYDSPLLVVEVSDTIPNPNWEGVIDLGDFSFKANVFAEAKALLAARATEILEASVAGLSLALPPSATPTIETCGTVVFALERETQRLLYLLDVTGSITMTFSTSASDDVIDEAAAYTRSLSKDVALESVVRLLSQSLQVSDNLQAFLTAWAGLEVFISKTFKDTYEARIYSSLTGAAAPSAAPFMKRLRDVMKDKYNISDKFVVVASMLNPIDADADIESFQDLKKQRDGVHNMRAAPQSLNTDSARTLLRKYVRLYLTANG